MPEPIELYLVRHGIAANRGDEWPDDAKRPLTHKGIVRLRQVAAGLEALGVSFDQIVTSPLVRSRQTAETLAEALSSKAPIAASDALAPAGTVAQAIEELGRHARRRRIAIVGHEPNIGELAAKLLGSRTPIEFKKGAVCRIDVETLPPARPGHLRWFATPRMLRNARK
ncbi:MAG TPA: phosphohistidine phosphatase SixA [Vicinamibacterales bacterium]|nr:phosphohistidine phosphatase SixA [Vicinamibacterales bacterium]